MRKSRLVYLVVFALLLSFLLPSCSNNPQEGAIEEVEIAAQDEKDRKKTGFTKLDSPYDYEYKTFTLEKARMSFDVPSNWKVEAVNSRYVRIYTPDNDGFIPGTTFCILANYGYDVDPNEMTAYTNNDNAFYFTDFFKRELVGIPFFLEGKTTRLRSYEAEDEIRNALDFVDKDHKKDVVTLTANSVVMMDKAIRYYTSTYGMVSTYVKWDHSPYCFFTITEKEKLVKARQMLEYIVSSSQYEPLSKLSYKEVSYDDFTVKIPSSFKVLQGADNIYSSPLEENSEYAGMSVGVFKIDDEKSLTAENISYVYGEKIAPLIFDHYMPSLIYDVNASEGEGPDFTGLMNVNLTGFSEPKDYAGSVFGEYAYYTADYYKVKTGKSVKLVVVVYQPNQKAIAKAVGQTAAKSLGSK